MSASEIDYTECYYYRRCLGIPGYEMGTCSFGCQDEPHCVTGDTADEYIRSITFVRLTQKNLFVVNVL